MKRMKFLIGMLAMALVFGMAGCDDVLGEFQKGLNGSETPAYSIVLSEEEAYVFKSAETELALLIVNSGDEATGALTAELTGDSEAFTLSKKELPSIKAGKSGKLVVAPVAGLAAGTYEAAVVLSGEAGIAATLDVSFTVEEAAEAGTAETEETTEEEDAAVTYEEAEKGEEAAVTEEKETASAAKEEADKEGRDYTPPEPPPPSPEETDEPVMKNPELGSYGISLSVIECFTYPQAIEGYGELPPHAITVTNTLSQPTGTLTLNLGSGDTWFALSTSTLQSIEAGGTATFTIAPKTGLRPSGYCSYMEIYGDNGIWARFNLSFAVDYADSPDEAIHSVFLETMGGLYVDANGGETLRVRHGCTLNYPASVFNVFKPGYTFGGWYKDVTYKTPWNFDTDTVTATMVLYAKWIAE